MLRKRYKSYSEMTSSNDGSLNVAQSLIWRFLEDAMANHLIKSYKIDWDTESEHQRTPEQEAENLLWGYMMENKDFGIIKHGAIQSNDDGNIATDGFFVAGEEEPTEEEIVEQEPAEEEVVEEEVEKAFCKGYEYAQREFTLQGKKIDWTKLPGKTGPTVPELPLPKGFPDFSKILKKRRKNGKKNILLGKNGR